MIFVCCPQIFVHQKFVHDIPPIISIYWIHHLKQKSNTKNLVCNHSLKNWTNPLLSSFFFLIGKSTLIYLMLQIPIKMKTCQSNKSCKRKNLIITLYSFIKLTYLSAYSVDNSLFPLLGWAPIINLYDTTVHSSECGQ